MEVGSVDSEQVAWVLPSLPTFFAQNPGINCFTAFIVLYCIIHVYNSRQLQGSYLTPLKLSFLICNLCRGKIIFHRADEEIPCKIPQSKYLGAQKKLPTHL